MKKFLDSVTAKWRHKKILNPTLAIYAHLHTIRIFLKAKTGRVAINNVEKSIRST